jgi:hypothetical protein
VFPNAGLSTIADVPGVNNGVVPFEHAVTFSPAVTGFLLWTAFLLLLAPLLILVSLFSWWLYILDCRMRRITLSVFGTDRTE